MNYMHSFFQNELQLPFSVTGKPRFVFLLAASSLFPLRQLVWSCVMRISSQCSLSCSSVVLNCCHTVLMSHACILCIPCIPCIPRSVIYRHQNRVWLVGGQFDYKSLKGKVKAIVCCFSNGHLVCNILVLAQTCSYQAKS